MTFKYQFDEDDQPRELREDDIQEGAAIVPTDGYVQEEDELKIEEQEMEEWIREDAGQLDKKQEAWQETGGMPPHEADDSPEEDLRS